MIEVRNAFSGKPRGKCSKCGSEFPEQAIKSHFKALQVAINEFKGTTTPSEEYQNLVQVLLDVACPVCQPAHPCYPKTWPVYYVDYSPSGYPDCGCIPKGSSCRVSTPLYLGSLV